jgi:integrase
MPKYKGVCKKVYPSGKVVYYGAKWNEGKTETTPVFPTAEEAAEELRKLINNLKSGLKVEKGKITFTQYAKVFLEKYVATKGNENSTNYIKESRIRNQLCPFIGHMKLKDIDGEVVQDLVNCLLEEYEPSTAHTAFVELRAMMKRAVIWDYIPKNPTLDFDFPKYETEKPEILTPEQIVGIIYNEQIDLRDRCIIAILGFTGIRPCECFPLMKEKIDFNESIIRIDLRYYMGVVKPIRPSSKGKPRTVPILPDLEPILKEWYLKVGASKWLFPGRYDKPLYLATWANNHFKPLLAKLGLPIVTPKSFRHAFDKMCSDNDVPPRELMQMMGHSTPDMTFGTYDRESVERMVEVTRHIRYR